jgi:hypothetical protein
MAITVLVHSMRGRPRATLAWSLGIECLLLAGFTVLTWISAPFGDPNAPGAIAALLLGMTAMGVQSALVRLLMRGVASANVMTTNTTLLAISAAEILLGWIECRRSGSAAALSPDYAQAHNEFAASFPLGVGFFGGNRHRCHRLHKCGTALHIGGSHSDRGSGVVVRAPLRSVLKRCGYFPTYGVPG